MRVRLLTGTMPRLLICEAFRNSKSIGKFLESDIVQEKDGIFCYLKSGKYEEDDVLVFTAEIQDSTQTLATAIYKKPWSWGTD